MYQICNIQNIRNGSLETSKFSKIDFMLILMTEKSWNLHCEVQWPIYKKSIFKTSFRNGFHSVEISGFFCHSHLTWNQFEYFWNSINCVFAILEALNFVPLVHFWLQKSAKFFKSRNSEPLNVLEWHISHFYNLFEW